MKPIERVLPIKQVLVDTKLEDELKLAEQRETLECIPRDETLRLRLKHVG